jgi:Spy/CpxP family protein refolding chaperone
MRLYASRQLALFCVFMSMVLLASTAPAQRRTGRPNSPGTFAEGQLMKRKAKDLGLSEEVIAKIDAAIEAGKAEEEKIREESLAALTEMTEKLEENLPKEEELLAATRKVGESTIKTRELKMKFIVQVRSLLTPEQLEKYMEHRRNANRRR